MVCLRSLALLAQSQDETEIRATYTLRVLYQFCSMIARHITQCSRNKISQSALAVF